jgi:3-isopropylmalate/(R)-2-methylmalate dehydratase small subunit
VKAIETITGPVSVLNRDDVDTDQIIPKQFLKRVERTGFGEFLFFDWAKEPGWSLPANPILVAGENFGCGSSREHAPWALADFGFRVIIAPSFADIFANNCLKNGLLPVVLSDTEVAELARRAAEIDNYAATVDLERREVTDSFGFAATFAVDEFQRQCLLQGLDDIDLTLQHEATISAYEARHPSWLRAGLPI